MTVMEKIKVLPAKLSLTQNQAVLPRKNINNPGPCIASPHPDPMKGKSFEKVLKILSQKFRTQQGTVFKVQT